MRKPEATAQLLGELKALGVRIAVDDFGTGYSSLAYLRQFPVDSLKIDRTFITGLALSSEAHALTHTLIQLGKALGLQTLAEGVEHAQSGARAATRGVRPRAGVPVRPAARPRRPRALPPGQRADPSPSVRRQRPCPRGARDSARQALASRSPGDPRLTAG